MAAVIGGIAGGTTTDGATFTTGGFAPAANDLLVACVVVTGTGAAGSMSDSLGGSWTQVATALKAASADKLWCFIRDTLSTGVALTVTMDVTGDDGTGFIVVVLRVSGMPRTGNSGAARQSATQDNQAGGGTPGPSFPAAALTGNPTIGFVANAANPAALTPPTDWTERQDAGIATPDTGIEVVSRDSGFEGTQISWGGTSGSAFGAIIVELNAGPIGGRTLEDVEPVGLIDEGPLCKGCWVGAG